MQGLGFDHYKEKTKSAKKKKKKRQVGLPSPFKIQRVPDLCKNILLSSRKEEPPCHTNTSKYQSRTLQILKIGIKYEHV
jgi:hypothetical protein